MEKILGNCFQRPKRKWKHTMRWNKNIKRSWYQSLVNGNFDFEKEDYVQQEKGKVLYY